MAPDETTPEPLTAAQLLAAALGQAAPLPLIDLFHGYRKLGELLDQAEAGWLQILYAATAIEIGGQEVCPLGTSCCAFGASGWKSVLNRLGCPTPTAGGSPCPS